MSPGSLCSLNNQTVMDNLATPTPTNYPASLRFKGGVKKGLCNMNAKENFQYSPKSEPPIDKSSPAPNPLLFPPFPARIFTIRQPCLEKGAVSLPHVTLRSRDSGPSDADV